MTVQKNVLFKLEDVYSETLKVAYFWWVKLKPVEITTVCFQFFPIFLPQIRQFDSCKIIKILLQITILNCGMVRKSLSNFEK